jgi:tRNA-2-methylthio-N6-dimethylallyladenosine synthase
MRRTYTREQYLEKVAMIRAARRPISITSDIIVGFPGETEQDFEETLSLLDAAQYDSIYAFEYSPRPHTTAQHKTDAVPEEEKRRRLTVLNDRQQEIQLKRNEAMTGKTFEILVDGVSRKPASPAGEPGQWTGRSSSNRILNFSSQHPNLLGQYVHVRVTRASPNSLVGEQIV